MKRTIDKDCEQDKEIELIAYRCRICKHPCEIGSRIMRAYEQVELEEYHRKIETE